MSIEAMKETRHSPAASGFGCDSPGLGIALGLLGLMLGVGCEQSPPIGPDGKPVTVGQVKLWTYPKGAKVWVDGELEVVSTPATLVKEAGTYSLEFQVPGAESYETDVTIYPGRSRTLRFDLPKPPDSTVTVFADVDGASVRINGYKRGETPLEDVITKPGPLDITVLGPYDRARSVRDRLQIGEHKVYRVSFSKNATVAKQAMGRLTLGLKPDGEVWKVGGERIGQTPLVDVPVPAGRFDVLLRSGDRERRVTLQIPEDELAVYRFRLFERDQVEASNDGEDDGEAPKPHAEEGR
jgi:hypothetical protein